MTIELVTPIILLAFLCELVDSSLGMGIPLGAVLSVPLAAYVVSRIQPRRLTLVIGSFSTMFLGGYTLVRVLV